MPMKEYIESGKAVLGIEFGSTRIKAVLIGEDKAPIASGSHDWENSLVNGIWTYSLEEIWEGLQDCYSQLAKDVKEQYDVEITQLAAIGFSAMMHGYMAFDKDGELLVPFRTWRNAITEEASEKLTKLFNYPIPQRWSIAHLYQAMLNGEAHVKDIAFQTTLAGYIHWKLSGKKVLGVGEASGMFPIDIETRKFNTRMIDQFNELTKDLPWTLDSILPEVLLAGDDAGVLTAEGAKLLDVSGKLEPGIPMCPPEGDAGTGMAATNSVKVGTGNISAGTSVFGMVVLEKDLKAVHPEIDLVTTPSGDLVGMVHCNNCTSDLNAWVNCFKGCLTAYGVEVSMPKLYDTFYFEAVKGDPDCGNVLTYNYVSGENITGMEIGRPLVVRTPESKFDFPNFAKATLYSTLSVLKIGLDIMLVDEGVKLDSITGHGGLYKTPKVGQQITANAIDAPVTVMETAGEGGAWGMALLADYMIKKEDGETLDMYLENKVFADSRGMTLEPQPDQVEGFNVFIERYKKGLAIERAAVNTME
ncbi:MAG: FGGY-family carbohydrate kinase [Oscillospiraceae bacterium]|nr:FGGY-family carbohydrate kinase [Oscillospiraceae bacterium]